MGRLYVRGSFQVMGRTAPNKHDDFRKNAQQLKSA
jgi:hypothetical protein